MFNIKNTVLIKYVGNEEIVVIPDSITMIGEGAFRFSNVKEIYIPKSVISIDFNAFEGCHLRSIYFEGSVEELNKIYTGEFNDEFFEANVYCLSHIFNDKWLGKLDISKIPKSYTELFNLKKGFYEIVGHIKNISFGFQQEILEFTITNFTDSIQVRYFIANRNFKLSIGAIISVVGSICYDVGTDKIVICADFIEVIKE